MTKLPLGSVHSLQPLVGNVIHIKSSVAELLDSTHAIVIHGNHCKNKTLQLSITLYLSVWTLRNRDKPLESEFDSVVEVHTLRDKVKTFLYRDSSLMNRDISLNLLRC